MSRRTRKLRGNPNPLPPKLTAVNLLSATAPNYQVRITFDKPAAILDPQSLAMHYADLSGRIPDWHVAIEGVASVGGAQWATEWILTHPSADADRSIYPIGETWIQQVRIRGYYDDALASGGDISINISNAPGWLSVTDIIAQNGLPLTDLRTSSASIWIPNHAIVSPLGTGLAGPTSRVTAGTIWPVNISD
jgi:hypothetical protein